MARAKRAKHGPKHIGPKHRLQAALTGSAEGM